MNSFRLMLGAILWPTWTYSQTAMPDVMAMAMKGDDIRWEPLGGGFEISILYINPTTQVTYLVIRGPGGLHVPRHWHTAKESITALKGTFVVAHDGSNERVALTPGSFAYMPARMIPEAWTEGDTMYFITVDGKWDVNFVE